MYILRLLSKNDFDCAIFAYISMGSSILLVNQYWKSCDEFFR